MRKKLLFGLICQLFLSSILFAQNNVGINNPNPNASAALDVTSTTQGFLPPRMTQAQRNAIVSPAAGLIIYCTDCAPATLYLNNGNSWGALIAAAPATFVAGSLSCTGTLAGTYNTGVATNSSNTKQIVINVAGGGTYGAFTNTVNGVSFAASGVASAGSNTIILAATGTPAAAGTFSYTVALGGQSCTFNVTYTTPQPPATFGCSSATKTITPAGNLINGTTYSGTYTLPYLTGNGQAYSATTVTSNGLTLTRTAGTYSTTSGNVVYTLSGTYTGVSNGGVSFNLLEGCLVTYGDAIRGALANGGCSSCVAYDAAATNTWVSISADEYSALTNAAILPGSSKQLKTDADLGANPDNSWGPGATVATVGGNAPIPGNSYVVALQIKSRFYSNSVSGAKIKTGATAVTGTYQDYGSVLPPTTSSSNGSYYYVIKRPTGLTSSSPSYVAFYTGVGGGGFFGNSTSTTQDYFQYADVNTLSQPLSVSTLVQLVTTTTNSW